MSKKTVKISIAGSTGRMGKMLVNLVDQHVECELVAATCHPSEADVIGKDAGLISGINNVKDITHFFALFAVPIGPRKIERFAELCAYNLTLSMKSIVNKMT